MLSMVWSIWSNRTSCKRCLVLRNAALASSLVGADGVLLEISIDNAMCELQSEVEFLCFTGNALSVQHPCIVDRCTNQERLLPSRV